MFALLRYVAALVVFVGAIAVYLRNDALVTLDLYTFNVEAPLALLLAAALAAGMLVGYTVSLGRQWRLHHRAAKLARKVNRLQSDLDGLKATEAEHAARQAAEAAPLALPHDASPTRG
jgi:uncharacterized membrane protein YciS (DUF1049 family)